MASPYLNYFNRLFGRKPATPTPFPGATKTIPGAGKKYVQELDKVLHDSQNKLNELINSMNSSLRLVKKSMVLVDFTKIKKPSSSAPLKPRVVDTKPITGFDFKTHSPTIPPRSKRKANLPINPIFESTAVNWKKQGDELEEVMKFAYQEVFNILQTIAKDSGYTPKGTNIKSLISELKNFGILDRESALEIRKKLIGFITAYKQLETWLSLFRRTETSILKAKKTP